MIHALSIIIIDVVFLQDDENALLQQALAMSMDDPSGTVAVRDTDMADASADDHDLQLG